MNISAPLLIIVNNEYLWPRQRKNISAKTSISMKPWIFNPVNLSPSTVYSYKLPSRFLHLVLSWSSTWSNTCTWKLILNCNFICILLYWLASMWTCMKYASIWRCTCRNIVLYCICNLGKFPLWQVTTVWSVYSQENYSSMFMQSSHHAQSNTCNASSIIEVVHTRWGNLLPRALGWTHKNICEIKPQTFTHKI